MSQFITADKLLYARAVGTDLQAHFGARTFYSRAMVNDALERLNVDPYFRCWMYALFCSANEFAQIDACKGLAWEYHELRSQMTAILHALDEQKRGPPTKRFWQALGACVFVLFLMVALSLEPLVFEIFLPRY